MYKKRFVANLHHLTSEAHFQKWRTQLDFSIPDDMHVMLAEPSMDDVARMDSNDPDARIITFHPFYFSLSF